MTYARFSCIRQGPREEARGGMGRLEAGVKWGKGVTGGGELGNQLVAGLGFRGMLLLQGTCQNRKVSGFQGGPSPRGMGVMSELGSKHRAGNRA